MKTAAAGTYYRCSGHFTAALRNRAGGQARDAPWGVSRRAESLVAGHGVWCGCTVLWTALERNAKGRQGIT